MKVTVIVPNYNHAHHLTQRIESILNQTFHDFELIILDDCSTDDSRTIINKFVSQFPEITCYFNTSNSGSPFKQWDYGVKKAKGEFIWIAESDDFADPCFLEMSSAILTDNENIGLVYCNSKIINELTDTECYVSDLRKTMDEKKWTEDYSNKGLNEINEYLYLNNTINNVSGVLFRKSRYIEAGYADHSMKYCGDWFLYLRILLISDIYYLSSPLNTFRIHASSTSNKYHQNNSYLKEVVKVYLFAGQKISLSLKKRVTMVRILLGIIYRIIINYPVYKPLSR